MVVCSSNNVARPHKKAVNVFLIFVYIISIIVDLYNGYMQNIKDSETIIPIIYKGGIILYCSFFMFSNKRALLYSALFVLGYLCCVCYWSISGYSLTVVSLIGDFTRLAYPYAVLLYLYTHRNDISVEAVMRYVVYGCVLVAISIIIFDLLGIGVASYGETYGYGTKGLFIAGNDVSLFLILGNLFVSYLFTIKRENKYIVYSIIISVACMLIGTTSGIVGVGVNYLSLILQPLLVRYMYNRKYKAFCWVLILIGVPLLVQWTINIINTDEYTLRKFSAERLISGGARDFLGDAFLNVASSFDIGDYLWGVGYQELGERVGAELRLNESRVVELNQYEFTGYYGMIFGGILLLIPIWYLAKYVGKFVKRRFAFDYWMIIALMLFVGHGFTAGHAYNSLLVMIVVVSIMFLYIKRCSSVIDYE